MEQRPEQQRATSPAPQADDSDTFHKRNRPSTERAPPRWKAKQSTRWGDQKQVTLGIGTFSKSTFPQARVKNTSFPRQPCQQRIITTTPFQARGAEGACRESSATAPAKGCQDWVRSPKMSMQEPYMPNQAPALPKSFLSCPVRNIGSQTAACHRPRPPPPCAPSSQSPQTRSEPIALPPHPFASTPQKPPPSTL